MIIKYVHDGNINCTYYENENVFLKECYKSEFKDTLLNAKDVIVLENNGNTYSCNMLLEVYQKYKSFVIR